MRPTLVIWSDERLKGQIKPITKYSEMTPENAWRAEGPEAALWQVDYRGEKPDGGGSGTIAASRRADARAPSPPAWLERDMVSRGELVPGHDAPLPRSNDARILRESDPMGGALDAMQPYAYKYKPGVGEDPNRQQVGPMAQPMARDPVARTAIVKDPSTGMLGIDVQGATKLALGGLGYLKDRQDATDASMAALAARLGGQGAMSAGETARAATAAGGGGMSAEDYARKRAELAQAAREALDEHEAATSRRR